MKPCIKNIIPEMKVKNKREDGAFPIYPKLLYIAFSFVFIKMYKK